MRGAVARNIYVQQSLLLFLKKMNPLKHALNTRISFVDNLPIYVSSVYKKFMPFPLDRISVYSIISHMMFTYLQYVFTNS